MMAVLPNLHDLTRSNYWNPLEAHLIQRLNDEMVRLKTVKPEDLARIQAKIAVIEELLDLPHSLSSPKNGDEG